MSIKKRTLIQKNVTMIKPSLHSNPNLRRQNKVLHYMKRLDVLVVIGAVIVVTFFWSSYSDKTTGDKSNFLRTKTSSNQYISESCSSLVLGEKNNAGGFQRESRVVHRGKVDETEFLWQLPDGEEKPKAILFLGHGCHHSMTDWFPSTKSSKKTSKGGDDGGVCPECIGLPEELAIVKTALEDFNMMVVAISSADRHDSRCWSGMDGPIVAKVLLRIQDCLDSGNKKIPLLAFGASSGGGFVSSVLPQAITTAGGTLHGYISQIAASSRSTPLSSVFITMNRDTRTDANAKEIIKSFQEKQLSAKHIRLDPVPLKPDFFSERILIIDSDLSTQMVQDLKDAMLIDDKGMLQGDPRQSNWRSVLQKHADKIDDGLVADASPLSEVMNVAWGMHEMARDGVKDALSFLMKNSTYSNKL